MSRASRLLVDDRRHRRNRSTGVVCAWAEWPFRSRITLLVTGACPVLTRSLCRPTRVPPMTAPPPVSTPPGVAPTSASAWGWGWWLLGLLVAVAAVVGIVMLVRARRARKAWETELAAVEAESTWLAHELVPTTLTGQDATARHASRTAYRPRVEA